ncbi:ABC transporter ATP-binding protein [Helicobacter macacae]|uniref:ABC transporter domain-containing protein n=1 Tax=Helicobacter macacae MIT 99-5501 TaxID=1357400 RepID=V8C9G0_9HELI|nr:ABC transporter ATP-binding protein [Helicobacter macacae]ETD23979.1 hypothetical protein HMPREF2086_00726 [Helicobacter macacae MIT 99-5501]
MTMPKHDKIHCDTTRTINHATTTLVPNLAPNPPLLEVKNLNFSRTSKILSNINFSLQAGEILSVLGRNGAGKTTLLKCLLGFIKATSGEVRLNGVNISHSQGARQAKMWDNIAYVAQNKGIPLAISALEMVTLGLNSHITLMPKKSDFEKASQVLDELKIAHLKTKNCASLSGGELQMVLFARALVKRPKILVLDEPESNLDFANQKTILDMLKDLSKQGCAIIINTHFPAHALFLSNKVLLISKIDSTKSCAKVDFKVDFSKDSAKIQNHDFITACALGEGFSNGIFGGRELLDEAHLSSLYGVPLELHSMGANFDCQEFIVRI